MSIITITSSTQLATALANAKGGETFALAAGNYTLSLSSKTFASPVTITSLDSSKPANFDWVKLTDASNLTFKSVSIGRTLDPTLDPTAQAMAKLVRASNITFDSVNVHGSMDNNALNDGMGITVSGGSNVKVVNSNFTQLFRAVTFGATTDITLSGNTVKGVRSDGFDFVAVKRVLIENNLLTDFFRTSVDHPDAIQFWTTNSTTPSTDIVIRNNQILQGNGAGIQGIFMRDELGTLPFENVTIENNLVYEANMQNGVTVIGGKNINIRSNTVTSPQDDTTPVWIRVENINGGTVSNNVTDKFYQGINTNLTFSNNLLTSTTSLSTKLLSTSLSTTSSTDLSLFGIGYQSPTTSTTSTSTSGTSTLTSSTTQTEPTTTTTSTTLTQPTTTTTSTTTSTTSPTTTTTDTSTTSFTSPTLSDTLTTSTDTSTSTTTTTASTDTSKTIKKSSGSTSKLLLTGTSGGKYTLTKSS